LMTIVIDKSPLSVDFVKSRTVRRNGTSDDRSDAASPIGSTTGYRENRTGIPHAYMLSGNEQIKAPYNAEPHLVVLDVAVRMLLGNSRERQ